MTHRRRSFTGAAGIALAIALFGSMLFAASADAAPCFFFFFCPPPHTTTTTTTTSRSSSSTVTSTTVSSTSVSSTQTSSTSTTATSTTSSSSPSGLPTLTEVPAGSGEHGFPYDAVVQTPDAPGAPYFNLSQLGYDENEYLMSGTTNTYNESGSWGSNGDWNVSVAQPNVPYTSRLLVRFPTNPAKFNGTVIVEWLNDTTGGDQDPVWSEIDNEVFQDGYAYIGVTAQNAGLNDLATWDPERYGTLGDTNDSQSYDIFTQAAEVARDDPGLLGGLTVKNVIGAGDSQSAFRVDTYVNAFEPITHAFNAFMAIGRAVTAAPLGNGLVGVSPFPALIRTNNTAPFIQVNTQGDILELDAGAARQPDNTDLRTWEVAGASHIDAHEALYELEDLAREEPTEPVPACVLGTPISGLTGAVGAALNGINQVNNIPLFEVEDAALNDLQNWLVNGVPAPHESSSLSATSLFGLWYIPTTNQYGLASGGIQLPEAQVPTEDYGQINFSSVSEEDLNPIALISDLEGLLSSAETGGISNPADRDEGLCLLSGYFTDLGNSTLESLYPTLPDYVAKYTAAVNADEAAGFITPADAAAAIATAQAGVGPLQTPPETIP